MHKKSETTMVMVVVGVVVVVAVIAFFIMKSKDASSSGSGSGSGDSGSGDSGSGSQLKQVTGDISVCGQSGQDNCASFKACDLVKAANSCTNVKKSSPIDWGSTGSKGYLATELGAVLPGVRFYKCSGRNHCQDV